MLATIHARTFLSSRLLSKNIKICIYKIIILPLVLYGCETWSLILNREHRQRVFGNGAEGNIWTEETETSGQEMK
jgi:hypothetical protein